LKHFISYGVLFSLKLATLNRKDLCFEIWSNTVKLQVMVYFLSSEVRKIILCNLHASHISILYWICRSVGQSTAAFVQAVLEGSTQPGVWFPEEVNSSALMGRRIME
jgi:hypothetical protein